MTSRRCPTCRTFCEAERDVHCHACGRALPSGPGAPVVHRPQLAEGVELQVARDRGWTRAVGSVVGICLLFYILPLAFDSGVSPVVRGILVVALLAGAATVVAGLRARPGTAFDTAGRVVLRLLATVGLLVGGIFALIAGLVVLLLIVCATGGLRIAG
jgi:hypothetical protein